MIPKDTFTFKYYNANPKNHKIGDCVVRAVSTFLDKGWSDTYLEMANFCAKYGLVHDDTSGETKYLKFKGFEKQKQPRKNDNTKYTGEEFCRFLTFNKEYNGKKIIAHIGGHHMVCIKQDSDGAFKVHDIWNSTDGCIGNWWIN